jgi:dephospho-CoA kinase
VAKAVQTVHRSITRGAQWADGCNAFSDPAIKGSSSNHSPVGRPIHPPSQRSQASRLCIIFDIPLAGRVSGHCQQLDHVLVVDCTQETQISRVMARDAMS